ATSVVGTDDLLQILWVEPGRERRRADEVAEHDRNLAALSVVPRLGLERGCRRGRELGDCCQHLAPMPDRDAKFLQVLICQMTEDRGVDIVLGKALGVLGHTERGQPLRNCGHLLTLAGSARKHDTRVYGKQE